MYKLLILCLISSGNSLSIQQSASRRVFLWAASSASSMGFLAGSPHIARASAELTLPSPDAKGLFNQARAFEQQGNLQAAQRLYEKITAIAPDFVYGWSNLGNTQTAFGQLQQAEASYTKAIDLCSELDESSRGRLSCGDLYVMHLNRGSIRLNTKQPQLALQDLLKSNQLRGRPDEVILPNLARAYEFNQQYEPSSNAYDAAIRLAGNNIAPYWLRASLVEYQLDRLTNGYALLQRVQNKFPEAPEVKAALAVYTLARGNEDAARKVFLEIPNKQRLKFNYCSDESKEYLDNVISWPPRMKQGVQTIAKLVGDC